MREGEELMTMKRGRERKEGERRESKVLQGKGKMRESKRERGREKKRGREGRQDKYVQSRVGQEQKVKGSEGKKCEKT